MSRSASVLMLAILLSGCAASSGFPSASPSDVSAPPPSPTVELTPIATQGASAAPPGEEPTSSPAGVVSPDTVVTTTVEDLSVRRTPGTDGERIGFLTLGTIAYVLEGPSDVGSVPWYRITGLGLPYASGCATTPPDQPISCPAFHGWVSGASAAGDPWLAPADAGACPEPTLESISERGFTWRLICWAEDAITFDAWWPAIPEGAGLGGVCPEEGEPAGFLYCQHINYNWLAASPEEGFVNRLALSIDPATAVAMPERGQWIRVTGTFDHPSAASCADLAGADQDPDTVVLSCRLAFVPTMVEPLGS